VASLHSTLFDSDLVESQESLYPSEKHLAAHTLFAGLLVVVVDFGVRMSCHYWDRALRRMVALLSEANSYFRKSVGS